MRNPQYSLALLLLIMILTLTGCNGCFQKDISTVIPEALTDSLTVDLPESSFNIPISFSLAQLEDLVNHKISGKFLETNINPLGSEKDEAKLTFTKTKPITIRTVKDRLLCKVTLQAEGELLKSRYGTFITNQVKTLRTEVVIELETPVNFNKDWSLQTKFELKSVKWVKEPVLQVSPIKINLRDKLDDWLNDNSTKLTDLLNNELSNAVTLKPAISKIWLDLQKPIIIHKKVPAAWIKFTCDSVGGKILLEKEQVKCYANVRAKMMMLTDTNQLPQPTPLPAYKPRKTINEESDVYLYAFTSFDEINEQLNSLFVGKSITAKGYTIVIDSIQAYASTSGLSVKVKTGKDVEGTVVASGKLEFDTKTRQIALRNFDYAMTSNSTLLNAGDQFLHSVLQDSIASKLVLGLDTLIERVPQLVESAIAKGKPGNAINLTMDNIEIKDCDISMGSKKVHFKIHAGVAAGIEIKKINKGKALNIKTDAKK